jgi:hypothetical protein
MRVKVFSVNSVEQIEPHLKEVQKEGMVPNLAIVFSSVIHNFEELITIFTKYHIDIFGSSSAGEIINNEVCEESIVMMLFEISRDAYQVNVFDGDGKTYFQVGQNVAEWAKGIYKNPAFMVMVAGLLANGDEIIDGISHTMERQVPLFGGCAGDDLKMEGTFVFNVSKVIKNGVVALIFDWNTIDLKGIAVSGWRGIGTPKTITKSQGNIVYRIDNEPALDVYNKYLNINGDIQLGLEYPLLLLRDDGTFVMRVALAVNEDKSMVYGGTLPEGSKVRFSMPPGSEIIDHEIEQISAFSQHLTGADAVMLISCKARHMALGPMIEDEISSIYDLWKIPLIGFFSYGEIGQLPQGKCDFHNHTLVLVLIHEN